MIDAIYIGISGVKSHQTRLSVVSNNVANVNTAGYKGGRASFTDMMGQTLAAAGAVRDQIASTNPLQTGLGVAVGTIDTVLQQGSIQTTGVETDLAIEGEGYFVLSDGVDQLYTRDGTFSFDKTGRLIDPSNGLAVQGNLTSPQGEPKGEVEDLVVPIDRESTALATTQLRLSGNVDASGAGSGPPVWTGQTSFGGAAQLVSTSGFPLDFADLNSTLPITLTAGSEVVESDLNITPGTYDDAAALAAELNARIDANGDLKGKAFFAVDADGNLALRSAKGGADVQLVVGDPARAANDASAQLGFVAGTPALGTAADPAGTLNQLANVGSPLNDGDLLRFAGTKPTGEHFEGLFEFVEGASDTVEALLTAVEGVYGGVEAGFDPDSGRLVLTDPTGDQVTGFDLTIGLLDAGRDSGLLGEDPPYEFSTNSQVLDAKGESHSLTVNFAKTEVANQWSWVAAVDGFSPDAGGSGKAIFNADGTLRSFAAADGSPLVYRVGDGTPDLRIDIEGEATDNLGGLTQFAAPTSAAVRQQDGRASGSLLSVDIADNGDVRGLFSNGDSQILGRVVLASFNNPGGLQREGENFFTATEASGERVVGEAGKVVQGRVQAGAIELSNVDLADEFTDMIVTQRGFQANARSITTSDELLSELVNLKR